jgi:phage tail sheath protein FI
MANEYLYGAYGHIGQTVAQSAVQAGTVPVYIGTAPVNLVRGYKYLNIINNPVKLSNIGEAQRKLGYSSDWSGFTLCEVFSAHFDNILGNIGPIYVINALDPDNIVSIEKTNALTFTGGRAELKSDKIILDSLVLDDLVEGVDYSVDYNYAKSTAVITALNEASPITGSIEATYQEVDTENFDYNDIIGGVSAAGDYSGIGAVQLLYQEQTAVPNILAAPGWSHIPAVYNALVSASQKINGHWDAFVVADIPVIDGENAVDTIDKAKAWKTSNAYISERSKIYWPQGIDNLGRIFHLSTLATVEMLRTDFSHNSVPMETPGNKQISIVKLYFGSDSRNRGYDQQTAKGLTSNGISTAVAWGGRWVLWGDHTAAYTYGADVDPRAIFDVSMRVLMHITNSFQREWSPTIDKPIDRQLVDRIINREQEKLDALVSMGALIGEPKILFLESENSTTDLMNGDFRWDIPVTPTPPLKSATVYVAYTDAGFSAYFDGGES